MTGGLCGAGGVCGCAEGAHLFGGTCTTPPRPLAPLSLSDVTQRRPTLRWVLPAAFNGAEVQLCRDRACSLVIATLTATGSSVRPSTDLVARSVVFWRLRGRTNTTTDSVYGPTWLFHVPAVSASTSVDTSSRPHLDLNGDGIDDMVVPIRYESGYYPIVKLVMGAATLPVTFSGEITRARDARSAGDVNGDGYGDLIVGDSAGGGVARVYLGGPTGVGNVAQWTVTGGGDDRLGVSIATAGDVDGDGYADVLVGASQASANGLSRCGVVRLFRGSQIGVSPVASVIRTGLGANDYYGEDLDSIGDMNGDGLSDVIVSSSASYATVINGSRTATLGLSQVHGGGAGFGRYIVASAGDFNGDGLSDFVIGSHPRLTASVSMYFGSTTGAAPVAAHTFLPPANRSFGNSAVGLGDLRGNGLGVLATVVDGIVTDDAARLRYRNSNGTTERFEMPLGPGNHDYRVTNGPGIVLEFATGDVNGDGFSDLIVNSEYMVRVYSGASFSVTGTPLTLLRTYSRRLAP